MSIEQHDNEPNAPARIDQSPGVHPHVSPQERAQRRQVLSRLLVSMKPMDDIYRAMEKQFGMTALAVDLLESEICKAWTKEDARRKPFYKLAAQQRLLELAARAAEDGAWGAAVKSEELIAKVQGTLAPVEMDIRQSGTVHHMHTLARMLSDMPADEVRGLIEEERRRLGDGSGNIIDVEITPTEPEPLHVRASKVDDGDF